MLLRLFLLAVGSIQIRADQITFEGHQRAQLSEWRAIGPLPIGTREWTVSPFPVPLKSLHDARQPSLLVANGTVGWRTLSADSNGCVQWTDSAASYDPLRDTIGWSALQSQTQIRALLTLSASATLALNVLDAAEFLVRNETWTSQTFQADLYGYSRPYDEDHNPYAFTQTLSAGDYQVYIRHVYDVRSRGDSGVGNQPANNVCVTATPIRRGHLRLYADGLCLPSLVLQTTTMKLVSSLGRILVRNWHDASINLTQIHCLSSLCRQLKPSVEAVSLGPYQTSEIVLHLTTESLSLEPSELVLAFSLEYTLHVATLRSAKVIVNVKSMPLGYVQHGDPFKYTFRDLDGSTDFAVAIPPMEPSKQSRIIVALHGAGVVASDQFWVDGMARQQHAWTVLPTGKTSWGYDWHSLSASNVFAAVNALSDTIFRYDVDSAMPDFSKSTAIGHSNGGQGALYLLTHYADRFNGGLLASGYVKIDDYVSSGIMSVESHSLDSALRGVLRSSLSAFDNDLFLTNAADHQLMFVSGQDDDNVPVYHSRVLFDRAKQYAASAELVEVPGAGHWFDDIFRSTSSQDFIRRTLNHEPLRAVKQLVTVSSEQTGWLGLRAFITTPGRLGHFQVEVESHVLHLTYVQNLRAFTIDPSLACVSRPCSLKIDASTFSLTSTVAHFQKSSHVWKATETAPPSNMPFLYDLLDRPGGLCIISPALLHQQASNLAVMFNRQYRLRTAVIDASASYISHCAGSALIYMGSASRDALSLSNIDLAFDDESVTLGDKVFDAAAIITTFRLPDGRPACLVAGETRSLDAASKLLPIWTGSPAVHWAVFKARHLVAAGHWLSDGSVSQPSSYLE
ncbi:uncharacterized protein L969DRAFT_17439 [Mixia osmundae IAM 14324]|uniref:uncharacterized protein n=1 Tax=Mixia osmundae (strain CBS 9802 / IAM 14324 / JCM 22182 / KY 12970) TaxID=764103 RepID=UPI0004A54B30|nr:uncharacterized protein L969DRAFT_17439 [Mixia osmundae IAM 14324]KEI39518.1 hypothetical protein L969DRAFT_17439 [Mixia osmundae IAM 14324]